MFTRLTLPSFKEEKQRSLCDIRETTETAAMTVQRNEPTALAVRPGHGSSRSNSSNRKPLHCSYCDNDYHVRDTCWKLHGYPQGHPKHKSPRFNRRGSRSQFENSAQSSANHVKEGPTLQEMQSMMNGLFDIQFQQILSIMNNKGTNQSSNPKANDASICSGLSQTSLRLYQLVLDIGATDHIIYSLNLLINNHQNTVLPPVIMPSGEQAPITSTGTLPLNSVISLKNVLGVPSFKVDLMSVSKFTRGLNYSITFFPYWCILQNLTTIGLGKQRGRLYYLTALASTTPRPTIKSSAAIASRPSCSHIISSTDLWHRRLGHLSSSRLDFMAETLLHFPFKLKNACEVCALSKQCRLPFSTSSLSSVRSFELIYCDI